LYIFTRIKGNRFFHIHIPQGQFESFKIYMENIYRERELGSSYTWCCHIKLIKELGVHTRELILFEIGDRGWWF